MSVGATAGSNAGVSALLVEAGLVFRTVAVFSTLIWKNTQALTSGLVDKMELSYIGNIAREDFRPSRSDNDKLLGG